MDNLFETMSVESLGFLAWLGITGVFVVVEILTVGSFFFMFFAMGALITAFSALVLPVPAQLLVFLVSSSVFVMFGRPVARKWFNVKDQPVKKSNVDALTGKEVIVLETVKRHEGRVKIVHTGEVWSACLDHSLTELHEIPEGQEAVVNGVDAVKLLIGPKTPVS